VGVTVSDNKMTLGPLIEHWGGAINAKNRLFYINCASDHHIKMPWPSFFAYFDIQQEQQQPKICRNLQEARSPIFPRSCGRSTLHYYYFAVYLQNAEWPQEGLVHNIQAVRTMYCAILFYNTHERYQTLEGYISKDIYIPYPIQKSLFLSGIC
jgi:hypothetical protein